MKFVSKSEGETKKIAADFAKKLILSNDNKPVVIALEGELGSGKTTFIQGFTSYLGIKEKIKSPTFVLMKSYPLAYNLKPKAYNFLYHFDCYRIKDSKDLIPLGIEEIMNKKGNIVMIEWAERVRDILPPKHFTIHIDHISEHKRNIEIRNLVESGPYLKQNDL